MEWLLNSLFADPFFYISAAFALVAAYATLTFLRGFFAGSTHLFSISSNEDHLEHDRALAVHGVMLLLFLYILWGIIRSIAQSF